MLNAGYKKEAMKEYEKAGEEYKRQYEGTIRNCEKLHENKEKSVKILIDVDEYIHSLSNKPKEIEKVAYEIKVRRKAFEKEINDLKLESKKGEKISQNVAGAGVLAGAGVAAFGPTAAMGIATTFGTASTGTAIATLTGIAQTNAALAWLGGGDSRGRRRWNCRWGSFLGTCRTGWLGNWWCSIGWRRPSCK